MLTNTKTDNLTFVWTYEDDGEGSCELFVDGKRVTSWLMFDWTDDATTEARIRCLKAYVEQLQASY